MDVDLFWLESGSLRRGAAVDGLELRAGPDMAAVRTHMGDAVERLHRRVSQVGQLVHRIEFLRGPAHRGRHISFAPGHGSRLFGECGILFALLPTIEPGKWTFVPDNLQGFAPVQDRPVAVAHHCDAAVDLNDVPHTRHGLRPAGVNALHFAAEYGWTGNDSLEHAGFVDVDAEDRLAVDLLRRVQAFDRLADEVEVFRVFERNILRRRQARGAVRQFAVWELAPRGGMDDHAILCAAARWIDAPGLGCGSDQHGAGCGPHPAKSFPFRPRARAASTRILLQSASSSSATSIGSAVYTPWPISEWLAKTVTVPSVPMRRSALGTTGGLDGGAVPAA